MNAPDIKPINLPCAWNGTELKNRTDWIRRFRADELGEIDVALQSVKKRSIDLFDITREEFPLPQLSKTLADISTELESGRGMIMLRGLPLNYSPEDLRTVYWGIGAYLGAALSQNKAGELLGVVKDFQYGLGTTEKRGFQTNEGLQFHSDRSDVVGLLCVRKAKEGGASRIVSAAAVHNEILRRRPDLIHLFYENWAHSWQGEQPPGSGRAMQRPIFSWRDGQFTGLFSPTYIRYAQAFPEVARHTPQQIEALQLFDQLVEELALDMQFEPGDIQWVNNHVTYHSRTGFTDYPEAERRRVLLRLWLSVPGSRPISPAYKEVFGGVEAGELRGGVPCQVGWWRDVTQFRKNRTGVHATQGLSW